MKLGFLFFALTALCTSSAWAQTDGARWDPSGKSLPELISVIRNPVDKFDRTRAAEAAAAFGRNAVEPLCGLLREDEPIRVAVLLALSRMRAEAEPAVPALIEIAANPNDRLRNHAVEILGWTGPGAAEAVPLLIQIAIASEGTLQRYAFNALAAIGDPPAVQTLEDAYRRGDRKLQSLVLRALQESPETTGRLMPMLVADLARATPRFDDELVELLNLAPESTTQPLIKLLESSRMEERRRAAMALCQPRVGAAAADAVPAITAALSDSDPVVRFWAVKALGAIGYPARNTAPALIACLSDADADVRWQAIETIVRLGLTQQAAQPLRQLRHDPHSAVRQAAEHLPRSF